MRKGRILQRRGFANAVVDKAAANAAAPPQAALSSNQRKVEFCDSCWVWDGSLHTVQAVIEDPETAQAKKRACSRVWLFLWSSTTMFRWDKILGVFHSWQGKWSPNHDWRKTSISEDTPDPVKRVDGVSQWFSINPTILYWCNGSKFWPAPPPGPLIGLSVIGTAYLAIKWLPVEK